MASFNDVPAGLLSVAAYLRKTLPTQEAISIERRVEMFHGKQALEILLDPRYRVSASKNMPPIESPDDARLVLKRLLSSRLFIRAAIKGQKNKPKSAIQQAADSIEKAQNSSSSSVSPPEQPQIVFIVEPEPLSTWSDDSVYIWIYEGSKYLPILFSLGVFLATLALVMFPLWPHPLRLGSWYLSMTGVCLFGLLMAIIVLRACLFVLSRFFSVGLWLFPNLFADCGFFESFVPLYAWEAPSTKSKTH